jgi:hypothetical protein
MTIFPSIECLEKAKKNNISFCDCVHCGDFILCFNESGLCLECWEVLETYWWLVSPLENLSIVPNSDAFTFLGEER